MFRIDNNYITGLKTGDKIGDLSNRNEPQKWFVMLGQCLLIETDRKMSLRSIEFEPENNNKQPRSNNKITKNVRREFTPKKNNFEIIEKFLEIERCENNRDIWIFGGVLQMVLEPIEACELEQMQFCLFWCWRVMIGWCCALTWPSGIGGFWRCCVWWCLLVGRVTKTTRGNPPLCR